MIDDGLITGADGRHTRRAVASCPVWPADSSRRRRTVADGVSVRQPQVASPTGIPQRVPADRRTAVVVLSTPTTRW